MLVKTLDTVKITGESKNRRVRDIVSKSFCPWNPGTKSFVNGSTKIKSTRQTPDIKSRVEFKMVLAVRLAFSLSKTNNSLKIGIKAMDSVPNISKLKTKSGTRNAA